MAVILGFGRMLPHGGKKNRQGKRYMVANLNTKKFKLGFITAELDDSEKGRTHE